MTCDKQKLKGAIFILAKTIGKENSYSSLMDTIGYTLPELVKNLVYDLFLNKFDYRSCEDETYKAYMLILEYGTELKDKGFVDFKK
jgi:hypothetical protein